jgi:pimeloyl-ACP methyl ester carboxylesterase
VGDRLRDRFTLIYPETWGRTSLRQTATDLASLLDEVAGGRAAVAGVSMGGYLTFELLRQAPEKVSAAALVDTTAFADDEERVVKRHQVLRLIREGRYPEVLRAFAESVLPAGRSAESQELEQVLAMGRTLGAQAFAAGLTAILQRGQYTDVLRLLRVPILFLCGEADALTPPAVARRMAAEVPGARVEIVPGAGHLTPLEDPERTAATLRSFFEGALAGRTGC